MTVVEFSDFQCPYCSRVTPMLKRIRDIYPDRVRLVFRDFPLPIHKAAAKAAEAAQCANDQGKFWEMHDKLFENQASLQLPDLARRAAELGMDAAAFDTCLAAGKHAARVQKSVEDGRRYGVAGTPTFFVNGRMLGGAQSYQSLTEAIDEELVRAGIAPAPGR